MYIYGGDHDMMKVVILCGGKGARLRSATEDAPKALALINGKPIIWHIMKIYSSFGYDEFIFGNIG